MRNLIFAFLLLMPATALGAIEDGMNATCRIMALRKSLYSQVSQDLIKGERVDEKGPAAGEKAWYGGTGCVCKVDDEKVYILTAGHVVHSSEKLDVQFFVDGFISGRFPAEIEWSNYGPGSEDLAMISVKKEFFGSYKIPKPMPIADKDFQQLNKQTITSCGCPNLNWPSAFKGHIVRTKGLTFQFSPVGMKGRSGSPVFDEKCEKIVGVVIWFRIYAGEAVSIKGIHHYWGEEK